VRILPSLIPINITFLENNPVALLVGCWYVMVAGLGLNEKLSATKIGVISLQAVGFFDRGG